MLGIDCIAQVYKGGLMTWPGLRHVWDAVRRRKIPPLLAHRTWSTMYVHSLYGVRKADGLADMQIFFSLFVAP